jgi:hypothetical protein
MKRHHRDNTAELKPPRPLERLAPACKRNGVSRHIALLEAEKGHLPVIQLGGWYYTPVGALDQLIADRLAGKRD